MPATMRGPFVADVVELLPPIRLFTDVRLVIIVYNLMLAYADNVLSVCTIVLLCQAGS